MGMALLDEIRIAKPCPANWGEMEGDERMRHCALCKKNVFNLSAMSRDEAEHLIQSATGRICVRIYQREDGKVMTADCPRGVAAARKKLALALTAVFAFGFSFPALLRMKPIPKERLDAVKQEVRNCPPVKAILDKLDPPSHVVMGAAPVMTSTSGKP